MVFQLGPDIRTRCPLGADASSFAQPELQNRFDLAGTPRDRRQSDTEIGNEDWLVEAPTTSNHGITLLMMFDDDCIYL